MTRALDGLSGLEGWRWVLAWVAVTLAPGLALIGLMFALPEGLRGGMVGASQVRTLAFVGISTLLTNAASAMGQSVLLRSFQVPARPWIVASAAPAAVITLVSVPVVRAVFERTGDLELLRAFGLAQTLLGALLVGMLQSRVLRRAVEGAGLWVSIVLGAALLRSVLLEGVTAAGLGQPSAGYALMFVGPLLLGIGLRWLLTRSRSRRLALAGTDA